MLQAFCFGLRVFGFGALPAFPADGEKRRPFAFRLKIAHVRNQLSDSSAIQIHMKRWVDDWLM